MQSIPTSNNYVHISNIYDHIMRKVRYDYWADYIYALAGNFINNESSVLELGSGNCKLAKFLSAYFPKIIATDLSFRMLSKNSKSRMPKVCCDMTLLPFKSEFDMIVSAFDSVNYITTAKKMKTFFREILSHLTDEGIFTFDASLENNSYKHIKDPLRKGSYKKLKYTQESEYNADKKLHQNIFYITYPNGNTFKEIHIQKIYPFEYYFEIMDLSGLRVKQCYDSFTFKDGNANSPRVQFVVAKK